MAENPWLVESIQEFYFLKCPECSFHSKEENDFRGKNLSNCPGIVVEKYLSLK